MANMTFDTLTASKSLHKAGFGTAQAEAIALVIKDSQGELATKSDVDLVRADVDRVRAELDLVRTELGLVRTELGADIESLPGQADRRQRESAGQADHRQTRVCRPS